MDRQALDDRLASQDEALAIKLDSAQAKLQEFRDVRMALEEVIKLSKKSRSTKAIAEYLQNCKYGNENANLNNIHDPLAPNIKMERPSSDLKKTDAEDTGISLGKTQISSIKEEPNLMPPPTARPKRGRKKNDEKGSLSSSEASTSTRSSTRSTRSNTTRESDVVCTEPMLECLTLSDEESAKSDKDAAKKVVSAVKRSTRLESNANNIKKEEMLPPAPVRRTTRTKRNEKKAEGVNDTYTVNQLPNETEAIIHNGTLTTVAAAAEIEQNEVIFLIQTEDNKKEAGESKADDQNKRSRSPCDEKKNRNTVKRSKANKSDCNMSGTYEDAIDIPRESYKFKMDAVVVLEDINLPTSANKTYIADKPKLLEIDNCESTALANERRTVVISPKPTISNATIVCDKNAPAEEFNGLDDIMTDDDTPPRTTAKSNKNVPSTSTMRAIVDISPVKKLVQVFEKMGKGSGAIGKDKITPATTRQMKNTTPTQQNCLYTANGSTSKSNNPYNVRSASKTASAIKRLQLDSQERELLRRHREEEARKKREQHKQEQEEVRRKRIEAQELKNRQVQQKKEILEQQKLQHLEEIQRLKDEKARHVLQEKQERIDKHKEQSEKKRQRFKKAGQGGSSCKPIYMTQSMPLLTTTDCYDSDEENANVRTTRVKPAWTIRDQLYPTLRLMAAVINPSVRNRFFATKPNTPDLLDIFQDIDPVKLGRSSSAVWRKPPRYTLMHLPSFTEEAEPTE